MVPKTTAPSTIYSLKPKKHRGKKVLAKLSNFFKRFSKHTSQARRRVIGAWCVCFANRGSGENAIDTSTRAVSIVTSCTGQDAVYVPKLVAALGMNSARRLVQSAHKKSIRTFLIDPVNGLIFTGGDDKVIAIWNIESLFVSGESYIIDTSNFNYKVTTLAFHLCVLCFQCRRKRGY